MSYKQTLVKTLKDHIRPQALKKNNKLNDGIKQTWLFAHPDNKKFTGPLNKFIFLFLCAVFK